MNKEQEKKAEKPKINIANNDEKHSLIENKNLEQITQVLPTVPEKKEEIAIIDETQMFTAITEKIEYQEAAKQTALFGICQ